MLSDQIFVEANGLRHAVRVVGEVNAPAAILLHGFPNSSALWAKVAPLIAAKGYRVVLPDLRGFGDTDMASRVEDYEINAGAIPDIIALMEKLDIEKAHIVGHDFGAPVAWGLAAQHRERFYSLTAISVGHARAYLKAGMKQKLMSWYILFHQMRGICEAIYRFNNWALLRSHWSAHDDIDSVIANLSRPGRLTASLNWYRSNISVARMLKPPPLGAFGEEIVRIPTLGIWSDGDAYLDEEQMVLSETFVKAPWRYERIDGASHWVPLDEPEWLAQQMLTHWAQNTR